MKTIYDLEEKCEDHIGSVYRCVKILTSEDVGSGGTNVRSSDAYFFTFSLSKMYDQGGPRGQKDI